MVHDKLMLNPLPLRLLRLLLQNLLRLLRLRGAHHLIMLRRRNSIRQHHLLNIPRVREIRRVRHIAANSDLLPVVRLVLRSVPAKLRHERPAPAETGCGDGQVLGLVGFERFEEAEDSGLRDGGAVGDEEGREVADAVGQMPDFVELVPEAGGGEGFESVPLDISICRRLMV